MSEKTGKRTHVENIFQPNGEVPIHLNGQLLEKHVNKSKPAPRRPPGDMHRIGNYKPKILHGSDHNDNHQPLHPEPEPMAVTPVASGQADIGRLDDSKPLIIGDKHVPLQIENHAFEDDPEEMPIPKPRRKRRAPNVPQKDQHADEQITTNPIFDKPVATNTNEPDEDDFETHGGVMDFGPSFSEDSGIASPQKTKTAPQIPIEVQTNGDTGEYPYIPPPDYDDEEVTMDFGEETETLNQRNLINSGGFRDMEGEDFGQFLEDDDLGFDSPGPNWRPHPVRHAPHPPRHYDKRFSKPAKKPKRVDQKRNTIRDFSFSDSKIGWGDRTVKSTSAKGRYIKREKERKRIEQIESLDNGPDYQDFLTARTRSTMVLDSSPQSSDSGLGDAEDTMRDNHTYLHSQPRQFRQEHLHGKHGKHGKSSLWQKLTWRFRKGADISRHEPR